VTAWYNETDPYAAQWLRNLIAAGHIADGVVDERDIRDVRPDELAGFAQCHFFAGIGVWSHALRRAGWPDDRPIWTGSCPCQPFSEIGLGEGFDDERHLWPHWYWLISQCRPSVVAGEQVASKDGLAWLDLVSADMEGAGYAFGAVDICAAGFSGAHIRQREYFLGLGDAQHAGLERHAGDGDRSDQSRWLDPETYRSAGETGLCGGARWIDCGAGIKRPIGPGLEPVAHEDPRTMGRLRAYGNALDAETAAEFAAVVREIVGA
jgi:DNA (cytosine-5)-methyltransferase 1